MKRRILSVLCIALLMCLLGLRAYAAEIPDMTRQGSIEISMTYEGNAVPGGTLTLYRVAEVHVENGADYSFRYADAYQDCPVSLEDLGSPETAQELAVFTREQGISGTKQNIDAAGKIRFADLPLGLYLLIQENPAPGYHHANPFLVSVPAYENETYRYDVDASPKLALEPKPTVPTVPTDPTDPTRPPDLPQTGQNNLPIPILLVLGVGLCALGVILRIREKKYHER